MVVILLSLLLPLLFHLCYRLVKYQRFFDLDAIVNTISRYFPLTYRDLRSKAPNQILLNFCIALSLTLIVFLTAGERSKTSSMASCRAAAVALHYFVLVVFMWMAIEAFNMYLLFVKVMPSYFSKFLLKCCVMAWGKCKT